MEMMVVEFTIVLHISIEKIISDFFFWTSYDNYTLNGYSDVSKDVRSKLSNLHRRRKRSIGRFRK